MPMAWQVVPKGPKARLPLGPAYRLICGVSLGFASGIAKSFEEQLLFLQSLWFSSAYSRFGLATC
jgi:hypothetical protein